MKKAAYMKKVELLIMESEQLRELEEDDQMAEDIINNIINNIHYNNDYLFQTNVNEILDGMLREKTDAECAEYTEIVRQMKEENKRKKKEADPASLQIISKEEVMGRWLGQLNANNVNTEYAEKIQEMENEEISEIKIREFKLNVNAAPFYPRGEYSFVLNCEGDLWGLERCSIE